MKTLFVNGKYLSQPVTGVQRYARELIAAWDRALAVGSIDRSLYAIRVIAPRTILQDPQYQQIEIVRSRSGGKFWEQVELPWKARNGWLFSPYAAAPLFHRRHLVCIADAGVKATPGQYSRVFRLYYGVLFRLLGRTACRIFTISQFSKRELERYFSIPGEKIEVVYPGCESVRDAQPDPGILERFGLEPGQFVLGVSSRSPIKNFSGLAKAWKQVAAKTMKLAVAGGYNPRVFGGREEKLDSSIISLGYVADTELAALYRAAALFVYPSFYEGFGLPPVEAMACGCPVLVADSSSLPEVCGDAVLYCNPADPLDIAEKIDAVLKDRVLARELSSKGRGQAARYTAESCGRVLWEEIRPHL